MWKIPDIMSYTFSESVLYHLPCRVVLSSLHQGQSAAGFILLPQAFQPHRHVLSACVPLLRGQVTVPDIATVHRF